MFIWLPLHRSTYSRIGPWLFGGIASRKSVLNPEAGISSATFCLLEHAGTFLPLALIFEPHTAHLQPCCPVGSGVHEGACGEDALIDGPMPLSDQQSGRTPSASLS